MSNCLHCNKKVAGRSDKMFCSLNCKNIFNYTKKKTNKSETKIIDAYLHRNREILSTFMGVSKREVFDRLLITRSGFKYEFMTGIYYNKEGKIYHLIYDYAWMEFSDQKILVIRKAKQ